MKAPGFKKWFARLPALNQPQRLRVLHALRPAAGLAHIVALIEQVRSADRRCPRCQSVHWQRHGHANNLQRYRCRDCGRTFNDLTATPLARLRLREWIARFHGVASRYLPNYLGWRQALDGQRIASAEQLLCISIKPINSLR